MSTSLPTELVQCKYNCPGCGSKSDCDLPYYEPKVLKDKKLVFTRSTLCFKCSTRHIITYQVRREKKIKLVDFIFQDKSVFKKMKKTIELVSG